jgi:biotin operon repressor
MYDLWADDYVSVEECAKRLGISTARVEELVEQRVLKARWDGYTVVQPALIAGVTTGPGACG